MKALARPSGIINLSSLTWINADGGGIRGLSELLIIEEIMERVKEKANLDHVPLPADYFDLIGGTSTGGYVPCDLPCVGPLTSQSDRYIARTITHVSSASYHSL